MLVELRKVIPSFLTRVDRPERGGVWTEYLRDRREAMETVVRELWPVEAPAPGASVTLTDFDPAGEDKVLAAMCYPYLNLPEEEIAATCRGARPEDDRRALFEAYVGDRSNRRHRPGRAFERTEYRFDIVADYGAFRDLQRHRMLTIEWQPLGTDLGYEVPELVEAAGLTGPLRGVARTLQEPPRRARALLSRAERVRRGARVQHPLRDADERP